MYGIAMRYLVYLYHYHACIRKTLPFQTNLSLNMASFCEIIPSLTYLILTICVKYTLIYTCVRCQGPRFYPGQGRNLDGVFCSICTAVPPLGPQHRVSEPVLSLETHLKSELVCTNSLFR